MNSECLIRCALNWITRSQGLMAHLIYLICEAEVRGRSVRPWESEHGLSRPHRSASHGLTDRTLKSVRPCSDSHGLSLESHVICEAVLGLPRPPTASQIRPHTASHGLTDRPHRFRVSDWLRQITWQIVGGRADGRPCEAEFGRPWEAVGGRAPLIGCEICLSQSEEHGLPRPPRNSASHGLPCTRPHKITKFPRYSNFWQQ